MSIYKAKRGAHAFLRNIDARCCLIGKLKFVGLGHGCSCVNSLYRGEEVSIPGKNGMGR